MTIYMVKIAIWIIDLIAASVYCSGVGVAA